MSGPRSRILFLAGGPVPRPPRFLAFRCRAAATLCADRVRRPGFQGLCMGLRDVRSVPDSWPNLARRRPASTRPRVSGLAGRRVSKPSRLSSLGSLPLLRPALADRPDSIVGGSRAATRRPAACSRAKVVAPLYLVVNQPSLPLKWRGWQR